MKASVVVLATILLVSVAAAGSNPADNGKSPAVVNLLIGVNSDNQGLKESAANMLGELGSTYGVIPLMRMLHESDQESARIVAALALCKIGDARGIYAVKRAATFDSSDKVKRSCAWFYEQYVQPGSFRFVTIEEPAPRSIAQQ